jgi:exodeoxyribonuclease VII large subunit
LIDPIIQKVLKIVTADLGRTLLPSLDVSAAAQEISSQRHSDAVGLTAFLTGVEHILKRVPKAWVKAEVLKIDIRTRHTSVELIEHDSQGQIIAKVRAVIWPRIWQTTQEAFNSAGLPLTVGSKVLAFCSARFSPQHGFSLEIEKIDVSYTAGDLKLKAEGIKVRLISEGSWGLNKRTHPPGDFRNVVVISPTKAAGQADVMSSAIALENAGLVKFRYIECVFQRSDAPKLIVQALRSIYHDCREGKYCAVAIVRGGGAAADLAYLCDYDLTNAACRMPVPVMIGIGHETDRTLLDDVACLSFSTPSKLIGHIRNTVVNSAITADRAIASIEATCRSTINLNERLVSNSGIQIRDRSRRIVETAATELERASKNIIPDARICVDEAAKIADEAILAIQKNARRAQETAKDDIEDSFQDIHDRASVIVDRAGINCAKVLAEVSSLVPWVISEAKNSVDRLFRLTHDHAKEAIATVSSNIKICDAEIRALDPSRILAAGYAILRDFDGKPVTTISHAKRLSIINAELRDGTVILTPAQKDI